MSKMFEVTKIVAHDQEDYNGEKLMLDGMTLPDQLPVYLYNDQTRLVGVAQMAREGGVVKALIKFEGEKLDPSLAELLEGSVSGKILERDGKEIKKCSISYVSLDPKTAERK